MINEEIIQTLGKEINITKITPYKRGTINLAYEINSDKGSYVLKVNTKEENKELIATNLLFMNYFSEIIPVPKVHRIGENKYFPNGFILMDKCNGNLIADSPDKITKEFMDKLLKSIDIISETDILKVLGSETKAFQSRKINSQGEFYKGFMNMTYSTLDILRDVNSLFYPYTLKIASQMKLNPVLHSKSKTHLSHNDLSEENLFSDGELTGIIDFDSISTGDSDFDKHYSLVHIANMGIDEHLIKYGISTFFRNSDYNELIYKGRFVSQFSALQKIMVLRKKILAEPDKRSEYISETTSFLDKFMKENRYEVLLNEH